MTGRGTSPEMDFELIIGNLGEWDTKVDVGRYYPTLGVIAVDGWDGEWEEAYMADVLSHEFIHHLFHKMFGFGEALDNFRVPPEEVILINEKGIHEAWNYLSPVAKFALRCSILDPENELKGNGVI